MTGERLETGKGKIRSLNRRGTRSDKSPPVVRKARSYSDPSICEKCGSVYTSKTWRERRPLTRALMNQATWATCPACEQVDKGQYFGRVSLSGPYLIGHVDAIRARIANVERRARFTQPERRVVAADFDGSTLEVLTSSQKLAHRIAHEIEKAFGGSVTYSWSDSDGTLAATWHRE
ncbi:MAG TPA: hypothetical protein VNF27_03555 [Candidatus Binataceae bacterium]|nr:hypothetical protein [Candidatus Binataceae bacterium]